jgi:hypothetical protein
MSEVGHSRPGRADSGSGHVGFHPIATDFCVAAEFRDVPEADIISGQIGTRPATPRNCVSIGGNILGHAFCPLATRFQRLQEANISSCL